MRYRLFFSTLLLAHIASGQSVQPVQVPGTNYSLVPPLGFIPMKDRPGFEDSLKAATIAIDDAPVPFDSVVREFSKENFPKHDGELLSSEPAKGPFAHAMLLNVRQHSPSGHSYSTLLLISGNDKMSVMVVGNYPEGSPELKPVLKAALLSTTYHKPAAGKTKGH